MYNLFIPSDFLFTHSTVHLFYMTIYAQVDSSEPNEYHAEYDLLDCQIQLLLQITFLSAGLLLFK